jgi:DNA invertase Pin-like site-specific DNA recombinase
VAKDVKHAVAYLRTSSAANVGEDKDSAKRQLAAIEAYARTNGVAIVETFYDAAVSGADHVHERKGFAAMLARIEGNGVRVVLVETASRFASPGAFLDDTPTSKMIRQLLGVISEFEKASTVAKLAGARRRKRIATGEKVEGRKSHAEERPDVVALAKSLARKRLGGKRLTLVAISAELAARGHVNERGKPFHHKSVASMLGRAS